MSFVEAVQAGFRNYVKFSGRASLYELWYWVLFTIVGGIVAWIFDMVSSSGLPSNIFALVTLLPGIAVVVRRLHDTDRSGWWYFLILIPFAGIIILVVWCAKQGTPGDNRFGPPSPFSPPQAVNGASARG